MTRIQSLIRVTLAAGVLLGTLATPAAAQGVIATGSGRGGAQVAMAVALIGVIIGGLARSAGRFASRDKAIVALVVALMGFFLGALHLATARGAIGTGNGRAGAIVALVLGAIGMLLGRRALARSGRTS